MFWHKEKVFLGKDKPRDVVAKRLKKEKLRNGEASWRSADAVLPMRPRLPWRGGVARGNKSSDRGLFQGVHCLALVSNH